MNFSLQEMAEAAKGEILQGDPAFPVSSISTDSRRLKKGEAFLSLSGPHFDGHDFIDKALEEGASLIVLKKNRWNSAKWGSKSAAFLGVDDPLRAFGDVARAWRRRFSIPLIAVTGSNGKTTTKDLIASILSQQWETLATEGNLNNLIGVPQMLLKLTSEQGAAVIEMGMNDFGEIARLTEIAEPTVGLITNVANAHLEKLKDLEGVARAKGELFQKLPKGAVALVNRDDPMIVKIPLQAYPISFGIENPADVLCTRHRLGEDGMEWEVQYLGKRYEFQCALIGRANLNNAVAAVAAGFSLGLDAKTIAKGLKAYKGRAMRMERIPLKGGLEILNDCYNANPSSMAAALETFSSLKGNRPGLAILGEMLEMGDFAREGHREVGKIAALLKVGYLAAVGPYAENLAQGALEAGMTPERVRFAASQEALLPLLSEWAALGKIILVKGSRGARMEKVTEFLKGTIGEK